MKRVLVALGIILVCGILSVPLMTRILGPKLIYVSPPSGNPIGEFDYPRPESSVLAVNIVLPVNMMGQLANEKAPETISGTGEKSIHERLKNGRYAWEAARGPIEFQNTGQSLAVVAPFAGVAQFAGEIDAKILMIPLRTNAEIGGTLGGTMNPVVTPSWQINPQFVPQVNFSKALLSLGQLGSIDISEMLGSSLGQYVQQEAGKLAPALGQELDLRSEVEKLWSQAYISQVISDDPLVWLRSTPQVIQLAPVDYSIPDSLSLTVAIRSDLYITNRDPGPPLPGPLPDMVPLPAPVPTDLQLPVIASISEINQVLARENIEVDTGIGTKVEIQGMEAQIGQEGMLNLKLIIQADKSRIGRGVAGEIWLRARPVIDIEEQSLGFTDVELTVETRDKLTAAATWLVEGLLVKGIESQLRVDLDDYKAEINEEVQKGLQSANLPEGIDVSLENLKVDLADIYTVTRHFAGGEADPAVVVVIRASGNMETRINNLILKPKTTQ